MTTSINKGIATMLKKKLVYKYSVMCKVNALSGGASRSLFTLELQNFAVQGGENFSMQLHFSRYEKFKFNCTMEVIIYS